jgi:hypothetical protein
MQSPALNTDDPQIRGGDLVLSSVMVIAMYVTVSMALTQNVKMSDTFKVARSEKHKVEYEVHFKSSWPKVIPELISETWVPYSHILFHW